MLEDPPSRLHRGHGGGSVLLEGNCVNLKGMVLESHPVGMP